MPVVTVQLWGGRSVNQKRRLVAAITDAMVEHGNCGSEHLHVIIQDVPKDSWGRMGKLGIDFEPEPRAGAAPPREPRIYGFAHMAFRVSGVERLAGRLKEAGVKFFEDLHDGIYGRTIYVADPDGNKVEL